MGVEQELDTGTGTGGSSTLRMLADSSQVVALGIKAQGGSMPVIQSTLQYLAIPAATAGAALGAGAVGDYIAGILAIPASLTCGGISIQDGASTPITIFAGGGTSPLSNLVSFMIPLGIACNGTGWHVTTGNNVSAVAVGKW